MPVDFFTIEMFFYVTKYVTNTGASTVRYVVGLESIQYKLHLVVNWLAKFNTSNGADVTFRESQDENKRLRSEVEELTERLNVLEKKLKRSRVFSSLVASKNPKTVLGKKNILEKQFYQIWRRLVVTASLKRYNIIAKQY
jgi:hypothetical protein